MNANLKASKASNEVWTIIQVMRVNVNGDAHVAMHYTGNTITVRNSMDLSEAVNAEVKIDLVDVTGALTGNGVRTYTGRVPNTQDAVIVILRRSN